MPTNAELHGASYAWGFSSSDVPSPAISNFTARSATIKYEPAVISKAIDGEGFAESTARSLTTKRKITGSITGYIPAAAIGSANAIPQGFLWNLNSVSRACFVLGISEPRVKGDYAEVTIDFESDPLITSITAL